MRIAALLVGVLITALVGAFLVRRQAERPAPDPTKPGRTATVIGSASVDGTPDAARVYLGVTTSGQSVAAARDENARVVKKVQEALAGLKVGDLRIRTADSGVRIIREKDNPSK